MFKKYTITLNYVNEYTIRYDANGGSGAPGPQTKQPGIPIPLASKGNLSKTQTVGSEFNIYLKDTDGTVLISDKYTPTISYSPSSWNTQASGAGTSYTFEQRYTTDADLTLYAIWSATPSSYTLQLEAQSKEGYSFRHWNTKSDGSGNVYDADSTYYINQSLTLYAIWDRITTDITLDSSGGVFNTNASTSYKIYHGDTNIKLNAAVTYTGKTLSGWRDNNQNYVFNADGTPNYSNNTYWDSSRRWKYTGSNLTLYAFWDPTVYLFTIDANGGTINIHNSTYSSCTIMTEYEQLIDLKTYNVVQPKKHLDGYCIEGETKLRWEVKQGLSNIKVIAQWIDAPFKITYHIDDKSYTAEEPIENVNNLKSIESVLEACGVTQKSYLKFICWTDVEGNPVTQELLNQDALSADPREYDVYAKFEPRYKIVYRNGNSWKTLTLVQWNGTEFIKLFPNINK